MVDHGPIELLKATTPFQPQADRRPLIPEPLAVRLIAIDDVHLPAAAGLECPLDEFYVGLLGFLRRDVDGLLAYKADNFFVRFDTQEPPLVRDGVRPMMIQVLSLREMRQKLSDAKIGFEALRGLEPGMQMLLTRDPAGNWLALVEYRTVM